MVENDAAGENEDVRPKNTSRTTDEEPRSRTVADLLQTLDEKEQQVVQLQEEVAQREAAAVLTHHEQEAHRRDLHTQLDRAHQEITALSYDNERFQTVIVQTVVETLAQLGITRRRRRRSNSGGRTRNSSTRNRREEQHERPQHWSSNTSNSNSRVLLPASKPNRPRSTVGPSANGKGAQATAATAVVRPAEDDPPPRSPPPANEEPAVIKLRPQDKKSQSVPSKERPPPRTEHATTRTPMKSNEDPGVGTTEGIPPVSNSVLSRNIPTTMMRTVDTITTKDNQDGDATTSNLDKINFLLPLPYPDDWTLNMLAVDVLEDDTDDEASLVTVQKHDDSCALTYTGPSSSNQFVACVPTITPSDTGFYWKVTLTALPGPTLRGGSPCEVFIGIINTAVCGVDDVPSTKSWESSGSNGWKNGYSLSYERGCRQNRHPTLQAFQQGDTLLFGVTLDTFCMYSMFRQEQYCIYLPTSSTTPTTTPPSTSSIPEHYIHFNFSTKGTKVVLAPMDDEERKLLHP